MKPISPWFQTAALLSAIRHAICDLETARPDRSPNSRPIGTAHSAGVQNRERPRHELIVTFLAVPAPQRDCLQV